MDPAEHEEAERRLAAALAAGGVQDPRESCREQLRDLRQAKPAAYEGAVAYYRETLIPSIASGKVDPLAAWMEYGSTLASRIEEGTTLAIDPSGFAIPCLPPVPAEHLVLHIPDSSRVRAIPVRLPAEPSEAQQAALDLLVSGKQKLAGV